MWEDGQLPGAHPHLQQPRVDVHQCRAPGAAEQPGIDRIVEIQQQVRPSQHAFGLRPRATNELERTGISLPRPLAPVQQRPAAQPESLHSRQEGVKQLRFQLGIAQRPELFQPVDLTAQPAQRLRVLHVDPEVAAAVWEVGHLVDGDHDRAHRARSGTAGWGEGRSRKPIRRMVMSQIAWRTRRSHSVCSSTSRSAA